MSPVRPASTARVAAVLLIALTVVPMAATILLKRQDARPSPFIDGMTRLYGRLIAFTLRHRLALSYEANADGISANDVIDEILKQVAVG